MIGAQQVLCRWRLQYLLQPNLIVRIGSQNIRENADQDQGQQDDPASGSERLGPDESDRQIDQPVTSRLLGFQQLRQAQVVRM